MSHLSKDSKGLRILYFEECWYRWEAAKQQYLRFEKHHHITIMELTRSDKRLLHPISLFNNQKGTKCNVSITGMLFRIQVVTHNLKYRILKWKKNKPVCPFLLNNCKMQTHCDSPVIQFYPQLPKLAQRMLQSASGWQKISLALTGIILW